MNILKSYSDSNFACGSANRYQLYQFGKLAFEQGHLASALRWFSLAAMPDASGNNLPKDQASQAKAMHKLESLRNKIAIDEFQKTQEDLTAVDKNKLRAI